MDFDFNAIPFGVEYSQLTEVEKKGLVACLSRLLPFGWTDDVMRSWYVNRRLVVVRDASTSIFYGLVAPDNRWRLLLELKAVVKNDSTELDWSWKVGTFQWRPLELEITGEQKRLRGEHR